MCTRRHFLGMSGLGAVLGPALLEQSMIAAAQARAADAVAPSAEKLFDIEKIAGGVYAAIAKPQLLINSNSCIIVNEDDVMVVDTHSKPSAAKALIAQIRAEVTPHPVRYLVNTHFHWDHTQGNHAYTEAFPGIEIYASEATRQLLQENGALRLKQGIEGARKQVQELRGLMAKSTNAQEKAMLANLVEQGRAYIKEMSAARMELPTKTFNDTLVVKKKDREIHLTLLGRGHTSGDVVVHLPKERVVATGDLTHGFLPYIGDGFPAEWPVTLDKLKLLPFNWVSPGHGGVQEGKEIITNFRNYIEELTERVKMGRQTGKSLEDMQREITVASLKALSAEGYADLLQKNYARSTPKIPGSPPAIEGGVKSNIADIYGKLKA